METGRTGAGAQPGHDTSLEEATWSIHEGRAEDAYSRWPAPDLIISDGAYGIGGFPDDPPTPTELPAWYSPHIKAWTEAAGAATVLCVWNTELGCALLHHELAARGWVHEVNIVWSKGMAHVAGNVNTATLRRFPIVTESCAVYHHQQAAKRHLPPDLRDLTNVWKHPTVRGTDRLRNAQGKTHPNQKPLALMKRLVRLFSEPGGTVWEPFGGLCTASAAAIAEGRLARAAEPDRSWAASARKRLSRPPEPRQQALPGTEPDPEHRERTSEQPPSRATQ